MSEFEEILMQLTEVAKYFQSTSVDDILTNKAYWKKLDDLNISVMTHVLCTQITNSCDIVKQWLMLIKEIAEKDMNLRNRIKNGPVRKMYKAFMSNSEFPEWFIKLVLCTLNDFELLEINDSLLSDFLTKVFQSNDFNVQKLYVQIILCIFNNNLRCNTLEQKVQNKELLNLFMEILEEENEENIRAFLMKLNQNKTPVTIFSFLSSKIKLNRMLIGKDIWVDINILANTITFSCEKCFLSTKGHNLSMEEEHDLVIFKISSISNLKFRAATDDSDPDEMIIELNNPGTAYYEESVQFLKNVNTICFNITVNKDEVNDFVVNNFTSDMKDIRSSLNRSNFDLHFNYSISSPPEQPDLREDENESFEDSTDELDSALVLTSPEYEQHENCNSILKTPEEREDLNISVDESNKTGGSICYDSEAAGSEDLRSPEVKSTNISVAETENEPESDAETSMISETELPNSVPETPYSRIVVKTPEVINRSSFEVIDLISPVPSNTCDRIENEKFRTEQTCSQEQNHPDASVEAMDASGELENVMNTSRSRVIHKRKYGDDPDYSFRSNQSSKRGRRRKKGRIDVDDEQSEFDDTSFFSDVETAKTNTIKTRTRTVRKFQPFQCAESKTVKRIKTMLPVRTSQSEDRSTSGIRKRRLTINNSIEHLVEEPPSEAFSIAVPSLRNNDLESKFDRLRNNILSSESTGERRISFFSSTNSSQNSNAEELNSEIDVIDHEEIFPAEENVNTEVEPAEPSTSRISPPVNDKEKAAATKKGRPFKENKSAEPAEKPKRALKKKNQGKASPKRGKRRSNATNEKGTSNSSHDVCHACGLSSLNFEKKFQEFVQGLCTICLQSLTNESRVAFCAKMEEFFKNTKEQL